MPALPKELIARFTSEYSLGAYDAEILTEQKDIADYFILVCDYSTNYKAAANWVMGPVKGWVNSNASTIEKFPLSPKAIALIIEFIDEGVINFSVAEQKLFPALLLNPKQEVSQLIEKLNLKQTGDEDTLHQLIQEVLDENPNKVQEYKAGKTGLIGMFMGQIMKKSGGKADPKKTKNILVKLLDN
jgi:aspartyl-tRNA(Asn)/glutamyl-tRNA(Gln) amidotransferase subunit B